MPDLRKKWQSFAATLTPKMLTALKAHLEPSLINALFYEWLFWARDKQLPPPGDWRVWLLMAGRGFGKTRAGAEWIRHCAESGKARHIGLVGATFDDVRHVMIEGPSGLLSISPPHHRPDWLISKRLLRWPNGARARIYSADCPEQLRGPEFDYVWADEIAKWRYEAAWTHLRLALRRGTHPRVLATTTPQPKTWLKTLVEAEDTILVTGSTSENAAHLSENFAENLRAQIGPILARQELEGEFLSDLPGALWQRAQLDNLVAPPPPRADFVRILIGVDPAIGGRDETGIIVAGTLRDGKIWILEDASMRAPPHIWARHLQRLSQKWRAEAIMAEVNQGGDLVKELLQNTRSSHGYNLGSSPETGHGFGANFSGQNPPTPIRSARALKDKLSRAHPISAAYARGEVAHAASFETLHDQMVCFTPDRVRQSASPDRVDALVWVVSSLMGRLNTISGEFRL